MLELILIPLSDCATVVGSKNAVVVAPNQVTAASPIDFNHALIYDVGKCTNTFKLSEAIGNRGANY